MDDRMRYWIDMAEYDIDTAQAMLQTKRYLYVGFMCHQTIEKALKALIAKNGEVPPKIHHLMRLADIAGISLELSDAQQEFLFSLNPLNVDDIQASYCRYSVTGCLQATNHRYGGVL